MKYLFLIFCLVLCSCEVSAPDGDCPDPIKLSKKELLFSAHGGIDSVFIEDTFWWIEGNVEECEVIRAGKSDYCSNNYCGSGSSIIKIECSWFNATQTSEHTILVSVNQNETEEERWQDVGVQAGDCFSDFSIIQFAE